MSELSESPAAASSEPSAMSGDALRAQVGLFLKDFDAFASANGVGPGALSKQLFGRSGRVSDLRAGGGIGVETLAQACDQLDRLKREADDKGEAA